MLNSVPSGIVEVARARAAAGRPPARRWSAGRQCRPRPAGWPAPDAGRRGRRAAAEGAGQHQRGRAARRAPRRRPVRRRSCPSRPETACAARQRGRPRRPSGAESKSPTQSSGTTPSAAACRMPASAAMTRAPSICASRRGVRTRSPPSRMVNRLMREALTSAARESGRRQYHAPQTNACAPGACAYCLATL